MPTALSIINRGAEIIGYKDPDETLSGNDTSNFLGVLNSMVDAWATERLFVYAVSTLTQSVSGNPISIGTGATLNTPRPIRIPAGGFFREVDHDYPFEIITREQYAAWGDKTISTPWPRYCYYQDTVPTGSLYFYPALAAPGELHLPVEQRLTAFADISTDYSLAPGFKAALEYSLAEEIAPGRRPLDATTARLAAKYRRGIEKFEPGVLASDFERNTGNILSGWQ